MSEYFIDYEKVLADLESKRDALNDAINGIKKLLHVNAQMLPDGTVKQGANQITGGQDFASDAFFGISIREAIKKYLAAMKKPQPYRDIADALEMGGFQHSSKSFPSTVNTTLTRMADGDDPTVVKVRGEWGLFEWYPGMKQKKAASRKEDNGTRQDTEAATEPDSDESANNVLETIPEQPSFPNETEQPLPQSQTAP